MMESVKAQSYTATIRWAPCVFKKSRLQEFIWYSTVRHKYTSDQMLQGQHSYNNLYMKVFSLYKNTET